MHYKCLLITESFPTEEIIAEAMRPYSENDYYKDDKSEIGEHPLFLWDYYLIGGRYNGALKLRCDDSNNEKYEWNFYKNGGRNGKLFWSYLLSEMEEFSKKSFRFSEENYYSSMGSRDGFLYVDAAYIPDILNFEDISVYYCIDKQRNAFAQSSWDGNNFVKDVDFESKLNEEKQNSANCYATIIDLHD